MHEREKAVAQRIRIGRKQTSMIVHRSVPMYRRMSSRLNSNPPAG